MSLIASLKIYLINIVLAIAIAYLLADSLIEPEAGAIGLIALIIAIYIVLWLSSWFYSKTHFRKVYKVGALLGYFIKELVLASLKVAYDIVTPDFSLKPGMVAIPLSAKTDLEITLLANMVSLTPGTLSMAISEDRKTMYIHSLYITDGKKSVIDEIKGGFERRIIEITR